MELQMSCRMCAGIADPGVSLLEPAQQRLSSWSAANLDLQINTENRYPTKICYICMESIQKWMVFRDKCKKIHRKFCKDLGLPETAGMVESEKDDTASVASSSNSAKENKSPGENLSSKPITPNSRKSTMLDKWLQSSATQNKRSISPSQMSENSDILDDPDAMDVGDDDDMSEPEVKYVPQPTRRTRTLSVKLTRVKKEEKPDRATLDAFITRTSPNPAGMKDISLSLTKALQSRMNIDKDQLSNETTTSPKKVTPASRNLRTPVVKEESSKRIMPKRQMPVTKNSVTSSENSSPKETMPASKNIMTALDNSSPKNTTPLSRKPMPASKKIVSTSENLPSSKKPMPASKKPMPASKKNVSSSENSTPKSMPASKKPMPASKKSTPMPASKKPMPASKKTPSTTKKSTKKKDVGLPQEVLANLPKDQPFKVVPITKNGQTYYIVKPIAAADLEEETMEDSPDEENSGEEEKEEENSGEEENEESGEEENSGDEEEVVEVSEDENGDDSNNEGSENESEDED